MSSFKKNSGKIGRPSISNITVEYKEQRDLGSFVYKLMLLKCTDISEDSIFNLKIAFPGK